MKKREHRPTSKEGEAFIKPHKPNHKQRIMDALKIMKVGGTQEEIAEVAGMRPDQVWKRLSELSGEGKIFETGITRKLKSGVGGIVWQATNPEPEKFADNLINNTLKPPYVQKNIFE